MCIDAYLTKYGFDFWGVYMWLHNVLNMYWYICNSMLVHHCLCTQHDYYIVSFRRMASYFKYTGSIPYQWLLYFQLYSIAIPHYRLIVMSHESSTCFMFVLQACLCTTCVDNLTLVHTHMINWMQRTQTWKKCCFHVMSLPNCWWNEV